MFVIQKREGVKTFVFNFCISKCKATGNCPGAYIQESRKLIRVCLGDFVDNYL